MLRVRVGDRGIEDMKSNKTLCSIDKVNPEADKNVYGQG